MDTISLNSLQPDRATVAAAPAGLIIPIEERTPDYGSFDGVELTDGAGNRHLVEGRFNAKNNNAVWIYYRRTGPDGKLQQEENIHIGTVADHTAPGYVKIDGFKVSAGERLAVRGNGHEVGATAGVKAMGGIRGTLYIPGWVPVAGGDMNADEIAIKVVAAIQADLQVTPGQGIRYGLRREVRDGFLSAILVLIDQSPIKHEAIVKFRLWLVDRVREGVAR